MSLVCIIYVSFCILILSKRVRPKVNKEVLNYPYPTKRGTFPFVSVVELDRWTTQQSTHQTLLQLALSRRWTGVNELWKPTLNPRTWAEDDQVPLSYTSLL